MAIDSDVLHQFLQALRDAGIKKDNDIRIAVWNHNVIHLQVLRNGHMIQGYQLLEDGSLYGPYLPPGAGTCHPEQGTARVPC